MKIIPLTRGQVAKVDDEDYEYLSQWKWCATKGNAGYYAKRAIRKGGKPADLLMARFIVGVTDSKIFVDHRNNDTLDNTRNNLRVCSNAENTCNRRSAKSSTSKYLGVSFFKQMRKWKAQIQKQGKRIYLG
jgi:HNH endonuclease